MPSPTARQVVDDYHQRTRHYFEGYARGPETLDWDAQPAPFRQFAGAPCQPLPLLDQAAPDSALQQALCQPFAGLDEPGPALEPSLAHLAALLQLALGLTAWKTLGPDRWAVRANPSSGNLHPTEAYLLLQDFPGLADGLYHYCPERHALEQRAAYPPVAHRPQHMPRLGILLSSVMWREAWKYGERAFRYCQLDTGHALAALRYAAGVLGWSLQPQTAIGQQTLAGLAGLDRQEDFPARKYPETEQEEPELLLATGFGLPPRCWTVEELQVLAARSHWQGTASSIDRYPMYRWPVIQSVALASRQPDTEPAPPVSWPPAIRALRAGGAGQQPVAALLGGRRSAQRFDPAHVMSRPCFASLLARLQPDAGLPWDVLDAPPRIALMFFVSRVEGLAPGLYCLPRAGQQAALCAGLDPRFSFSPVEGMPGLLQLVELEPRWLGQMLRRLHCMQDIAASACLAVALLADLPAALDDAPCRYRDLFREAGLTGQLLYLEAEAHGLRGTGIGCFFDEPVHTFLGLSGDTWQSLYHFTLGLPVPDPRISSAPAYAGAS